MIYHWSLRDNKFPKFPRTLLSIITHPYKAVIKIFSTRPLSSKSSSPCTNSLVTEPKALIMIGITVTFMFHSFFRFSDKVEVLTLTNSNGDNESARKMYLNSSFQFFMAFEMNFITL